MFNKRMKQVATVVAICISVTTFGSGIVNAASKDWRHASDSITYSSPVWSSIGVIQYKLGVDGLYRSDGKKIVEYGNTYCITETGLFWSVKKSTKKHKWTYKGKAYGTVMAEAEFYSGIETQWVNIPAADITDSITATAYK